MSNRQIFPKTLFCRNPRCEDLLPLEGWSPLWRFCPSCRLAGGYGALLAGACVFLVKVGAAVLAMVLHR